MRVAQLELGRPESPRRPERRPQRAKVEPCTIEVGRCDEKWAHSAMWHDALWQDVGTFDITPLKYDPREGAPAWRGAALGRPPPHTRPVPLVGR